MSGVLVGFGPWILFWILNSNNTFEEAAVAGLVASAVVTIWTIAQGSTVKLLEIGSLAWFGVLTVMAFTAEEVFFADWSYVLSNSALALIVLASILAGRPFTRQYAKETVPEQYWDSPVFLKSTLVISWVWFVSMVVMAASSAVARSYPESEMWFNWIIPIGALIGAIKFTGAYPAHLKKKNAQPAVAGL